MMARADQFFFFARDILVSGALRNSHYLAATAQQVVGDEVVLADEVAEE